VDLCAELHRLFGPPGSMNWLCPVCQYPMKNTIDRFYHLHTRTCSVIPHHPVGIHVPGMPSAHYIGEGVITLLQQTTTPNDLPLDLLDPTTLPYMIGGRGQSRHNFQAGAAETACESTHMRPNDKTIFTLEAFKRGWLLRTPRSRYLNSAFPTVLHMPWLKPYAQWPAVAQEIIPTHRPRRLARGERLPQM